MVGEPGQVGIKHQLWPFWHPLLIYHVKDDKGDILPNILTRQGKESNQIISRLFLLLTISSLYIL